MANLNNMTTDEVQDKIWEILEGLDGETVLRAFTNWHGMQLLTPEFLEALSDDGYTDEQYAFEDDEDDEEDEEEEQDGSIDEDTINFLNGVSDEELRTMYGAGKKAIDTLENIVFNAKAKSTLAGKVEHIKNAFKAIADVCNGVYKEVDEQTFKVLFECYQFEEIEFIAHYSDVSGIKVRISPYFEYKLQLKNGEASQSLDWYTFDKVLRDRLGLILSIGTGFEY